MVDKKTQVCVFCKNNCGFISKYGLKICRRCFKERAEDMGFKKYG